MFREMRRKAQLLPNELVEKILVNGITGILAVLGDDEYPYTVPLNYVYENGKIYFHCAVEGHKLDAIRKHSKVSFCVIDKSEISIEEITTRFSSVVAFGKAVEIKEDGEKLRILHLLGNKYAPIPEEYIENQLIKTGIVKIDIEHATGKEAIELVRERNNK
jgi:nitroimidazol reductase NimA-like FMN-containing flavoprotein (pyridoxamine 5'-phosphate oxidase superfamily)